MDSPREYCLVVILYQALDEALFIDYFMYISLRPSEVGNFITSSLQMEKLRLR